MLLCKSSGSTGQKKHAVVAGYLLTFEFCSEKALVTLTINLIFASLGMQAFHSAQEVMASDHVEIHLQPAGSIVSKCKIHTLEQYMVRLAQTPVLQHSIQSSYGFTRTQYLHAAGNPEQDV